MSYQRRMDELTRAACLELLGTVRFGRLFFIHNALPAVRPVNHLVDVDSIVLRATVGAAITQEIGYHGMVVAYEADALDSARQLGWSVVVVGTAQLVTDRVQAQRYRSMIEPWVAGPADEVISISTEMMHGYRLVPGGLLAEADPDSTITGRPLA
jgi:hypothetical protein